MKLLFEKQLFNMFTKGRLRGHRQIWFHGAWNSLPESLFVLESKFLQSFFYLSAVVWGSEFTKAVFKSPNWPLTG